MKHLLKFTKNQGLEAALAFLLPFTLYLRTLAPTIYNLDSAELTTAAATLGITRATGYPLYILLGHLWSFFPAGDVGYRLNLFSAFCGALTIALGWLLLRSWKVDRWAAAGALGLLACAPFFWSLSTTAEVYTLQTALIAGLLLALQHWTRQPTAARMAWVGICAGLCLSNHLSALLLLPGCAWLVLARQPSIFRGWAVPAGLGGLLVGLSPYLYLPLRFGALPAFNYAGLYDASGIFHPMNLASWDGFWSLVLGRRFSDMMFHYDIATTLPALRQLLTSLWRAFLIIGIGPGLLGMIVLERKWRGWGIALLLMLAGNVLFYTGYTVVDVETMYLPILFLWAIWLGVGYQKIVDWLNRPQLKKTTGLSRGTNAMRALMLLLVLFALILNWQSADHSQDWSTRTLGESQLRQMEAGAVYFGWWDTVPVMTYLQLVEGQYPNVKIINRFLMQADDLTIYAHNQAAIRPVYADTPFTVQPGFSSQKIDEKLYRLIVLQ